MRCVVGVVLFLVLYFGSCKLLGEIVSARARASDPRHSQRVAQVAGAKVVTKYHALIAVGAGVAAILGCSLPTLLARLSERSAWYEYADDFEQG